MDGRGRLRRARVAAQCITTSHVCRLTCEDRLSTVVARLCPGLVAISLSLLLGRRLRVIDDDDAAAAAARSGEHVPGAGTFGRGRELDTLVHMYYLQPLNWAMLALFWRSRMFFFLVASHGTSRATQNDGHDQK